MRRLLDAGMRVFADRGFHAARVDDIVRAARTSHGTFYLYFTNKEDLLRALATECGMEMSALAKTLGPVGPDDDGYAELRAFLGRFFATYRRYGPVIHAWMEGHVEDRAVSALGVRSFTLIATALGRRMGEAEAVADDGDDLRVDGLARALRVFPRVAPPRVRRRRDARHRHAHRAPRLLRRPPRPDLGVLARSRRHEGRCSAGGTHPGAGISNSGERSAR